MESQGTDRAVTAFSNVDIFAGLSAQLIGLFLLVFLPRMVSWDSLPQFFPVFGFLFLGIGTFSFVAGLWKQITADERGVKWRDWRGLHFARWDEIKDYYNIVPKEDAGESNNILAYEVRLTSGKSFRFGKSWRNSEKLRSLIARRTAHVAVTVLENGERGFATPGIRPAELPLTFAYSLQTVRQANRDTQVLRGLGLVVGGIIGVPIFFVLVAFLYHEFARVLAGRQPLGGETIVMSGVLLLCLILLIHPITGFVVLLRQMARDRRQVEERIARGERFVVEREGLAFYQGEERYFASWDAISDFDFGHEVRNSLTGATTFTEGAIRIANGRSYPVCHLLPDYPRFQNFIRQYAVQGVEANIAANESEALGGIASRWTGGEEGKGDRIYHLRTRSQRSLLWLGWCTGLPSTMLLFLVGGSGRFLFLLGPLFLLGTIIETIRYWGYRVCIGESGLREWKWGKERFVAWEDIQEARLDEERLHVTPSNGKPLVLNPSCLAYGSEMKERIDEHLRRRGHRRKREDVPNRYLAQETESVVQQVGIGNG